MPKRTILEVTYTAPDTQVGWCGNCGMKIWDGTFDLCETVECIYCDSVNEVDCELSSD